MSYCFETKINTLQPQHKLNRTSTNTIDRLDCFNENLVCFFFYYVRQAILNKHNRREKRIYRNGQIVFFKYKYFDFNLNFYLFIINDLKEVNRVDLELPIYRKKSIDKLIYKLLPELEPHSMID